jgi:enoyl-CoA hydratase/carnithine racemase
VVHELTSALKDIREWSPAVPLIITGNETFFSAGADLNEITALNAVTAYEFAEAGQRLMRLIATHPGGVTAAIHGYCMGGGLDLALACHHRIATAGAVFAHRGAALGIITGWGGTQRLPRLIGQARALQMFITAEKLSAEQALEIGLVDEISSDPIAEARRIAEAAAAPVS